MFGNVQARFNQSQVRNAWRNLSPTEQRNVSETERLFSFLAGTLLTLYITRRSLGLMGLLFLGGYLVYRGLTGYCPAYNILQVSTLSRSPLRFDDDYNERPEGSINTSNPRDEAVWESFPASDPPASW